ncbi:MAG: sugar ABC transporter ATP-binding protein, partial [Clostridiales bacterium]|nr:sugar ABC transporter ATP-binding protein [Clostridiales bacterium]
MKPLLQVINISKVFPGVKALTDVSIDFYPGEVHALVGENGAGKSTLIKIIAAVYTATSGEVLLESKNYNFKTPRDALNAGISVIQQELSIAPDLSVAENIFLGCEPKKGLLLDRKNMEADAQRILDDMGLRINAKAICSKLTAAEQQMVEIAKVVSKNSKVIIFDEPTSSLSDREIDALFTQINRLKKLGVTMIYITHRMKELFQVCDNVTILRDGCKVKEMRIADTTEAEIVSYMVGRDIGSYYNRHQHFLGQEALRVENLTRQGVFKDISFHACRGEIIAFSGLVGAGRTEVMEAIFGATQYDSGKVFVHGEEVSFKSPADAIKNKIGFVTEDRRNTGIMVHKNVKENISLPSIRENSKQGVFINRSWENSIAEESVDKFSIKTPGINTIISTLSGGNQQKVILAKWLVNNSEILILDEPTRGIDVNAKSEFYALMNDFVDKGGCIIMVSSEMPEVIGVSDRVYVMREGQISGECRGEDINEKTLIKLASITSDASA